MKWSALGYMHAAHYISWRLTLVIFARGFNLSISLGKFTEEPWSHCSGPFNESLHLQIDSGKRKSENFDARTLHSGTGRFDAYVDRYPSLHDLQNNLDKSFPGKVRFQLPQLDALSGSVLRHCINFIDGLIDSLSPVMFKVGFTHNPLWRWGNAMYGYGKSNEKWSEMVVIYLAPEAHSPTMLEAALIEKYKGASMKL